MGKAANAIGTCVAYAGVVERLVESFEPISAIAVLASLDPRATRDKQHCDCQLGQDRWVHGNAVIRRGY
jgi:hypothetical protein